MFDHTQVYFDFIPENREDIIKEKGNVLYLADSNLMETVLNLNLPYAQGLDSIHWLICDEHFKNIDSVQGIWNFLIENQANKNTTLWIIGGGTLCDIGAFAASTFQRGIPFVLMPTTLLAMADASIGGKTGINFKSLKNYIGTFALPHAILINFDFLDTLPEEEIENGMAEIVKHILISDTQQWENLRFINWADLKMGELIAHSVNLKKSIVEKDFKEAGLRKILNFGHTVGHALESFTLEKSNNLPLHHGRAVATGILAESFISFKLGLLKESDLEAIEEYISSNFQPIYLNEADYIKVAALCLKDKKNKNGRVYPVLLNGIGKPIWDRYVNLEIIVQGLEFACPKEGISPENE